MWRKTSRAARALMRGAVWFFVAAIMILHLPAVRVTAAEQDAAALTEEEVRLFRINSQIPAEEQQMSNAEVFALLADGHDTWPQSALELRAKLASPEELQSLADEFIAYANSIGKSTRKESFCLHARRVFPDITAVRVLRSTFPENPRYLELGTWAGAIGAAPELSPEAAPAAVEFLQELYVKYVENPANLEAVPGYDRMEPGIIPTLIVGAFGNCGDAGFDALANRKVSAYLDTTLQAMGRIGTQRALDFIVDFYNNSGYVGAKLYSLQGLVAGDRASRPEQIQAFIRQELPQYLSDDDPMTRLGAVAIAELSEDPAFLGKLEELAASDPYTTQRYSDTPAPVQVYAGQEMAQKAIERIKKANNLYSERELLELELSNLAEQLAEYQRDAYGSPQKDLYIKRTQEKIEEVKKDLEALGEE